MEVTCDINDEAFDRFLNGESNDLVEHVGDCAKCQARMEASLDDLGTQSIEQTMRAIRIHSFTRVTVEAAVDVGTRFAKSAMHYLLKG